jgi:hypothetical protein
MLSNFSLPIAAAAAAAAAVCFIKHQQRLLSCKPPSLSDTASSHLLLFCLALQYTC